MASLFTRFCIAPLGVTAFALTLAGCVSVSRPVAPGVQGLVLPDVAVAQLPDLVLTKWVVLERGTAQVESYGPPKPKEVTATSAFGEQNAPADVGCIVAGMAGILQRAVFISPAEFWARAGASQEKLSLSCLLDEGCSSVAADLGLDFVVAAYHQRINVESFHMEIVAEGGFRQEDREVAVTATFDARARQLIDATKITGQHRRMLYHGIALVVPVVLSGTTYPTEAPCQLAGRRAAEAISTSPAGVEAPRIAVLAAETDPYVASIGLGIDLGEATGRDHAMTLDEAEHQLQLYYDRATEAPRSAHHCLCKAADQGHPNARYRLALLYEFGNEGLGQDFIKAYVWYLLADQAGHVWAADSALRVRNAHLTPRELTEANVLLRAWHPGQCAEELGAAQDNGD